MSPLNNHNRYQSPHHDAEQFAVEEGVACTPVAADACVAAIVTVAAGMNDFENAMLSTPLAPPIVEAAAKTETKERTDFSQLAAMAATAATPATVSVKVNDKADIRAPFEVRKDYSTRAKEEIKSPTAAKTTIKLESDLSKVRLS